MKTDAIQGETLYSGRVNGKSVKVQKETRFVSVGDPNGFKAPVEGIKITTKDKDKNNDNDNNNDIVTAETFLSYAGLSSDPEKRREKIAETIYKMTDYQCGRDSHEAYLY